VSEVVPVVGVLIVVGLAIAAWVVLGSDRP
jgi:hypothetical protein